MIRTLSNVEYGAKVFPPGEILDAAEFEQSLVDQGVAVFVDGTEPAAEQEEEVPAEEGEEEVSEPTAEQEEVADDKKDKKEKDTNLSEV